MKLKARLVNAGCSVSKSRAWVQVRKYGAQMEQKVLRELPRTPSLLPFRTPNYTATGSFHEYRGGEAFTVHVINGQIDGLDRLAKLDSSTDLDKNGCTYYSEQRVSSGECSLRSSLGGVVSIGHQRPRFECTTQTVN